MTTSYWHCPRTSPTRSLLTPQKTQCLIVGAGLTGLSIAYWLKQFYPQKDIVILDREHFAAGASGRNAGFFTSGSVFYFQALVNRFGFASAQRIWQLSEENLQLVREHIIQDHGADFDYQEAGAFTLCSTFREAEQLQQATTLLQQALKDSAAVTFLPGPLLTNHTHSTFFTAGSWLKNEGQLHPVHWLQQLRAKVLDESVALHERTEVYAFESRPGSQNTLVKTERGDWEAEEVYVATNAYLPWLVPDLSPVITPIRSQVLLTAPVEFRLTGPCYLPSLRVYFRQLPGGEILLGGMRYLDDPLLAPESPLITAGVQQGLEDLFSQIYNQHRAPAILQRWSGIMGHTENEWPVAGVSAPGKKQFYLGGMSGHGMGYCFILAKRLVEFAQGGEHPTYGPLKK